MFIILQFIREYITLLLTPLNTPERGFAFSFGTHREVSGQKTTFFVSPVNLINNKHLVL